jgi:hypothetical protein
MAIIALVISAAFLTRLLLITVGWYKDPVLRRFERYVIHDDSFDPIPGLLMWSALVVWSIVALFANQPPYVYPVCLPGLLLLGLAYLAFEFSGSAAASNGRLFPELPRWYSDLRERTTREERRRIAYMWLRLPRKTRLTYNSHDRAFLLWADFVILGTILRTVETELTDVPYWLYDV